MGSSPPPRKRFTTPLRVRSADTDASGAVHHAAYLVYFEVARVEALRGLGVPVRELAPRGIMMPVVAARLQCLRPARPDELLAVSVWLDRIGPASFSFGYEIARDADVLATGWTRMAVIDVSSGRAMRLPPWVRDVLAAAG